MRFRRRTKLFPGVVLNFSKSGVSTTFGVKGANVNFGRDGAFLNTGLPGTGLYDRKRIGSKPQRSSGQSQEQRSRGVGAMNSETEISSADVQTITCEGLQEFQELIAECQSERRELLKLIDSARSSLKKHRALSFVLKLILIGFFASALKRKKSEVHDDLNQLTQQLNECVVNVDLRLSPDALEQFQKLHDAFEQLKGCTAIWDVVQDQSARNMRGVGGAEKAIVTELVQFDFSNIPLIKSEFKALHFGNANGGDLYLYPSFMLMLNSNGDFGLVDLKNLQISLRPAHTVEPNVPPDGEVIGETWVHARKDGEPDRRYKDNWQIPVVKYARMDVTSDSGLNEAYQFSNFNAAEHFFVTFKHYQSGLISTTST